ncbi:LysM peptidoglycan-binding domain-containing protein [Alteromonas genovensis]|uniref:LysM peptidoglycan-binding domain-containing protein n=1 Tax=Alteromonas genovensis TaxID=471225 RepID=UPI002FE0BED4
MVNLKKRLYKYGRVMLAAALAILALPVLALQLKDSAPQTYTVERGDTLWDIASIFLNEPWLWPELWRTNTQIDNPHLIYPGDVIVVGMINGKPVLSIAREKPLVSLSPQTEKRVKPSPINTLAWSEIAPFINQHTIVDKDSYEVLPRVLGNKDANVRFAANNLVVSEPQYNTPDQLRIVRKQSIIKNLDGRELGVQISHVADASVFKESISDDSMLLSLTASTQETNLGDKIFNGDFSHEKSLVLKPAKAQRGFVVGDLHDHDLLGKYDVVILDLGNTEVEPGTVMGVYAKGPSIINDELPKYTNKSDMQKSRDWFANTVEQPALKVGEIIIYKTFNAASYGLITRANTGIQRGFIVAHP